MTANILAAPWVLGLDMPPDRASPRAASALNQLADAGLVAEARRGDAAALETLVRRHYRAATAVALAWSGNQADAEDIVHDAFVRAAERLDACRRPERFAQWLCAIVRNLARNHRSRGLAARTSPLEPHLMVSNESPERDLQVTELRERLQSALAMLPMIQREVVLLHDLDGRTHDEIAAIVGTSSGMSRQHLFKARKRLRQLLAQPRDDVP